jgi:hypothetical protein
MAAIWRLQTSGLVSAGMAAGLSGTVSMVDSSVRASVVLRALSAVSRQPMMSVARRCGS